MTRNFLFLVGVGVAFLAMEFSSAETVSGKDPTTDYLIETQSVPAAPETARCLSVQCRNRRLTCPNACKKRSTVADGKSACFIDCFKCETSCKHRKLNCYGFGAVCYDPRFIGGDGVMFYFHGQKDQDFCILSDRSLHINAHFIGKRPEGRSRDYTWVQSLGIMFASNKLAIGAKKVAAWSNNVDHLSFSYNGIEFTIPELEGSVWTSVDGQVVVERTSEANSAHVTVKQLMEVSLDVVPITDEESRVHNYQITDEDRFAHLQMQFSFSGLSSSVNGVLGQTYQPNFKTPVKTTAPMPVMGGSEKYLTSSLLTADCKVNQFSVSSEAVESSAFKSSVQCMTREGVMSCRR